jgi:transposase InsO family protein
MPVRQLIVQHVALGQSAGWIARCLGLVPRTVRRLVQRLRLRGPNALATSYPSRPYPHPPQFRALIEEALQLRRTHSTWGAGLVRVLLRRHYPADVIPTQRTLQRWFRRAGLLPAPSGRRSGTSSYQRAQQPHDVWQMDAADQVALHNGTQVCWLRIADECSGAVLQTTVFPLAYWNAVPAAQVQTVLRQVFRRWGRPQRLRVDNGIPWGSMGDLPTELTLWLLGLDIDITFNPPRRPQDNGVIERSQGTGKRWAEPGTCANAAELQRRLQEMDVIQREEYRSLQGRSRLAVYPELKHSGRVYSRPWERQHWRLDLVWEHLAGYAVPRQVDSSGSVSVYNKTHYVGKRYSGKTVYVWVDPLRGEWLFRDAQGNQVRTQPAEQLCRERIVTLMVSDRRQRSGRSNHVSGLSGQTGCPD